MPALAHSKRPVDEVPMLVIPTQLHGVSRLGRYVGVGAAAALAVMGMLSQVDRVEPSAEQVVLHGAPGVKHTTKGVEVRWRKRNTTVYIDSSVDELGPGARDAVREAFGTWLESEARLPGLTFDSIGGVSLEAKPDGKNTVIYAPITVKGHEKDLAITLTYSDERTGDIIESDIVINAHYPYETLTESSEPIAELPGNDRGDASSSESGAAVGGDEESAAGEKLRVSSVRSEQHSSCIALEKSACGRDIYDLENVLTHEAGHFFGLGEDVKDTTATMYVCTNRCETHKRRLTLSDTSVVTALYAGEFSDEAPVAAAAGCTGARLAPVGTPATSVFAAAASALLLAARRRRR